MDKLRMNLANIDPKILAVSVLAAVLTAVLFIFAMKSKKSPDASAEQKLLAATEQPLIVDTKGAKESSSKSDQADTQSMSSPIATRSTRSMSEQLENCLDVEAFLTRLTREGFWVKRLKNKVLKEKLLRLNNKGELCWGKTWFPKPIALSSLMNVIESPDPEAGFILEFRSKKFLHLQVPDYEFPFDSSSVVKYFKTILRVMRKDPSFVSKFLVKMSSRVPLHHHEDDNRSVTSELTMTTINTNADTIKTKKPFQ